MADLCRSCVRASVEWAKRALTQGRFSEETKDHYRQLIAASEEWLGPTEHTCPRARKDGDS